ncbi:MAG TPA: type IV pilus assembly protein PilM [Armatimonadota bacterium]
MAILGKFSGASNTVGIDIGSHSIKVVQVVSTRNGYALMRAGSTLTPVEAVKQGVVEDRFAVAESVRRLLQDLGITSPMAIAALSGPSVVVRQVQLPAMPEHQLRKSIYWEARNYISFPVEDSLLEFQILNTHTQDGIPQMDVMLVAAPRELVDSRVAALEQAGVEPIAVELEPFALIRAAIDLPMGLAGPQESLALVDIGATYTNISIIANGIFGLTRSVMTAGNSFTEAIAKVLGVEMLQAERIKEEETQVVVDEASRAQLSPVGQEASRAIESTLEELVREIRRSFAFYDYQQNPAGGGDQRTVAGISRVILSGGSAKLGGIAHYLQDQLSIPVDLVDLFGHHLVHLPDGAEELQAQMPLLATAFGLALREPMLARERGGLR